MTDPTPTDLGTSEAALLRRILRAAGPAYARAAGARTARVVIDCELPVSPDEIALIERLTQ